MKWMERLSNCLDYVEENLKGEIDLKVICDKVCLSRLYFYRLFEAVTHVSFTEYIRKRRMTLAVKELKAGRKVIDVAYDYGYSSPEAFSRAFKSVHKLTPSQAIKSNSSLKSYPRLVVTISLKGEKEMNYKLERKSPFKVLGRSLKTSSEEGRSEREIPQFWDTLVQEGVTKRLASYSSDYGKMLGVCFDEKPDHTLEYALSVPWKGEGDKADFEVWEIPEAEWAIFESIGPLPEAVQNTWKRILSEWLPATGYELSHKPKIECYYPLTEKCEEYRCEIWLPIHK
ncbi:MAG: AraC family transcriptional regulator [Spirochaetales bacterium]|nr:AraC family transcriptional regulator [Spirochaetales bacterium]